MFTIETITELQPIHKQIIFDLWNNEYPSQLQFKNLSDLDAYLKNLKSAQHYFVQQNLLNAWAFTFERDCEIWLAMIVDGALQGKKIGTQLLNQLKQEQPVLNAWVIDHQNYAKLNGTPYLSPLKFYLKNDFEIVEAVRLELPDFSALKMIWKKFKSVMV